MLSPFHLCGHSFYLILNVMCLMIRIFKNKTEDGIGSDYNYIQILYYLVGNMMVLVACWAIFGFIMQHRSWLWILGICLPHTCNSSSSSQATPILLTYMLSAIGMMCHGGFNRGVNRHQRDSLPSISTKTYSQEGVNLVTEEAEKPQEDIDSQFEAMVKRGLSSPITQRNQKQRSRVSKTHSRCSNFDW